MVTYQAEVSVINGTFVFLDADAPSPLFVDYTDNALLVQLPTRAGVQVMTAANDFYPAVEFRLHEEAPQPVADWDYVTESFIDVESGLVQLMNPEGRIALRFPLLPGRWKLRAHSRGREKAMQRWIRWDPNEFQFHGYEEWLFQLWPDPDGKADLG